MPKDDYILENKDNLIVLNNDLVYGKAKDLIDRTNTVYAKMKMKKYTDFIVDYTKKNEKVIAFPEEDTVFFDGKNIRVIGELAYYTFENGNKEKIDIE